MNHRYQRATNRRKCRVLFVIRLLQLVFHFEPFLLSKYFVWHHVDSEKRKSEREREGESGGQSDLLSVDAPLIGHVQVEGLGS